MWAVAGVRFNPAAKVASVAAEINFCEVFMVLRVSVLQIVEQDYFYRT
jgi:hypothetical protein